MASNVGEDRRVLIQVYYNRLKLDHRHVVRF